MSDYCGGGDKRKKRHTKDKRKRNDKKRERENSSLWESMHNIINYTHIGKLKKHNNIIIVTIIIFASFDDSAV